MARKAEWKGCCQACGRLQMLPGGVLSDHGYEISHGWRNGVCYGAGHLPIEESCDLIQASADNARVQAARLKAQAGEELAVPLGALESWKQVYHPELSNRSRGSVYLWERGAFVGDGIECVFEYGEEGRKKKDRCHGFQKGVARAAEGRAAHVKSLLSRAERHESYAAAQEKVLAAWAPKPLIPRGKN